jgi:hypothetical protein
LLSSFVIAPIIAKMVAPPIRSVVWDVWGLGSTTVLLSVTYGVYVAKMGWDSLMSSWLPSLFEVTTRRPAAIREPKGNGRLATGIHVIFFMSGVLLIARAGSLLYKLWLYGGSQGINQGSYNEAYGWYIWYIFLLSILFVAMDFWVAIWDSSHSESFMASSSCVYSTFPMFLGICLIGLYVLAAKEVPIEFISGALTFQMIMSNTLFVLIKIDLFRGMAYSATRTTNEP